MSARDEALDLIQKMLPPELARAYRELFSKKFDAHAHELAEQQRAWIDARSDMPWWVGEIPDLIDPEVLNSDVQRP